MKLTPAFIAVFTVGLLVGGNAALAQDTTQGSTITYELAGPLVPASMTFVTAWDIPKNPLTDSLLARSPQGDEVRWGFKLFVDTPREAARFTHNRMSCNNCHLNAGQREKAMPLVGIAGVYPEFNQRAGRAFSLEDRIVGCFMRSEDATGGLVEGDTLGPGVNSMLPAPSSREVLALAAYLKWLSRGYSSGEKPPGRGQNVIAKGNLIPVGMLDTIKGSALFAERCSSCHGAHGEGVQIGDKRAGPLWGPDSWNDGAGAARVYTLAGMIRYAMPYLNPGSLTDEEAQQIAVFINSMPRPRYPFKQRDYPGGNRPADALYYNR